MSFWSWRYKQKTLINQGFCIKSALIKYKEMLINGKNEYFWLLFWLFLCIMYLCSKWNDV